MGVSGPDLALALLTFQRTGKVPEGFDISQVAGLQKLMFSQETLRSPAALLQSQMSIDLLAQGKSPQDIFGRNPKRGGLFPMSAEGAQARAKAVDQALGQRPEGEKLARVSRAERERQMRREVSLIRAWVKSLDIKFKTGASQQEKVEAIKAEIRNRMLRAFGLK
jgi:anti-sigma28 factor (negative regulator of flagellin synthesis)